MQIRVNEPYKFIDRGPIRSARTPHRTNNDRHWAACVVYYAASRLRNTVNLWRHATCDERCPGGEDLHRNAASRTYDSRRPGLFAS